MYIIINFFFLQKRYIYSVYRSKTRFCISFIYIYKTAEGIDLRIKKQILYGIIKLIIRKNVSIVR